MNALVLCGGYGRRLGSLCETAAKPLLRVGDASIVEHILIRLARHHVRRVWINLHYRVEDFVELLGDGRRFGVELHYLHEPSLRGTAGTAADLAASLGDDDAELLVHYGDILTEHPLDRLISAHRSSGAAATALVHRRQRSNSRAWIGEDGWIRRFEERPEHPLGPHDGDPFAFSGICVLSPPALAALPSARPLDLPRDVFPGFAAAGHLYSQIVQGYRCAVDSPERLAAAREAFLAGVFGPPPSGTEQAS